MLGWLACRPVEGPPPTGEILFVRETAEQMGVWQQSVDGTAGRPLPSLGRGTYPGPNDPQETSLLLVGVEEEPTHQESLYLLPKTGGQAVLLAPPAGRIRNPSWAPDGSWLYVEADWRSFGDIYRVPRTGGEPARLTAEPGGSFEPAVSPDGTQVAFGSSRDGDAEIYTMAANGGAARRRTNHAGDDIRPRWLGPQSLAWLRREGITAQFYRMNLETGESAPLRETAEVEDLDLVSSPDGRWAAITFRREPNEQGIAVVDLQSGKERCRLDEAGPEEYPVFSPDSAWLAFGSSRSGDVELWLARNDCSGPKQLTDRPGADWLPRWMPP